MIDDFHVAALIFDHFGVFRNKRDVGVVVTRHGVASLERAAAYIDRGSGIVRYVYGKGLASAVSIVGRAIIDERAALYNDLAAAHGKHAGLAIGIDDYRAALDDKRGATTHRAHGNGKIVRIARVDAAVAGRIGQGQRHVISEIQRRGACATVRIADTDGADLERMAVEVERNAPCCRIGIADIPYLDAVPAYLEIRAQFYGVVVLRKRGAELVGRRNDGGDLLARVRMYLIDVDYRSVARAVGGRNVIEMRFDGRMRVLERIHESLKRFGLVNDLIVREHIAHAVKIVYRDRAFDLGGFAYFYRNFIAIIRLIIIVVGLYEYCGAIAAGQRPGSRDFIIRHFVVSVISAGDGTAVHRQIADSDIYGGLANYRSILEIDIGVAGHEYRGIIRAFQRRAVHIERGGTGGIVGTQRAPLGSDRTAVHIESSASGHHYSVPAVRRHKHSVIFDDRFIRFGAERECCPVGNEYGVKIGVNAFADRYIAVDDRDIRFVDHDRMIGVRFSVLLIRRSLCNGQFVSVHVQRHISLKEQRLIARDVRAQQHVTALFQFRGEFGRRRDDFHLLRAAARRHARNESGARPDVITYVGTYRDGRPAIGGYRRIGIGIASALVQVAHQYFGNGYGAAARNGGKTAA